MKILGQNFLFILSFFFTTCCFAQGTINHSLASNNLIKDDAFLVHLKALFESHRIKVQDDLVVILPEMSLENVTPEILLGCAASFGFCAAIISYALSSSQVPDKKEAILQWCNLLAVIFECVLLGYLLYQKFGFKGPLIQLDEEGLKYKNQMIFPWSELEKCVHVKPHLAGPEHIKCYDTLGRKILSLNNRFVALPNGINFQIIEKLINRFFKKYKKSE